MKIVIVALLALVLVGCATTDPIEVSTIEVERAPLILPAVDTFQARNVEWIVITPDNYRDVTRQLEAAGDNVALFALTDNGYEALAKNIADIQKIIVQYQAIVQAYKDYYTPEDIEDMREVGLIGPDEEPPTVLDKLRELF